MDSLSRFSVILLLTVLLSPTALAEDKSKDSDEPAWGHSHRGVAYDAGPRQKPWLMEGIGEAPFPITTAHPEVQQWFDQGNALLHGFWWFEAERTFRWCLKLDPECAMAYWGLARAVERDKKRSRTFLEEASDRKDSVTERERRYIELYEAKFAMNDAEGSEERAKAKEQFMVRFDRLLMDYPDDIEAKALYWLDTVMNEGPGTGSFSRFGMEAVFQDVLAENPEHVGVLHYRIHNWDGKEGQYAIDSCMRLPEIAPACGHLLHMPGHVLSGIGLWHEAAIAMDSATRVEKEYMHRRMILPEQNWDYIHNLDYLCYIQEQLGMQESAILGAQQLLLAPTSPKSTFAFGLEQLCRVLVKFERWQDILDETFIEWDDSMPAMKLLRGYAEARAHIGLGNLEKAREQFDDLGEAVEKVKKSEPKGRDLSTWMAKRVAGQMDVLLKELEARLAIADDDPLDGIRLLTEAAVEQEDSWYNDPPGSPIYLYNALGEAYLELGSPKLAIAAFDKTLETVFRDGFALSGLVRAHHALGNLDEAREALGVLKATWSDADPNRWLEAALATGLEAAPLADPRLAERNYRREVLDVHGPSLYTPPPAPSLIAKDVEGKEATLERYRGKNVLVIFYLGEECVHCIEQLQAANERVKTFEELDTVILAVSKDSVEEIAAYSEDDEFKLTLLSDPTFESARRYHSYDDFEEIELHSTILLDKEHRVHWSKNGGEPFMDFEFIEREVRRLEEGMVQKIRATASAGDTEDEESEGR